MLLGINQPGEERGKYELFEKNSLFLLFKPDEKSESQKSLRLVFVPSNRKKEWSENDGDARWESSGSIEENT